MPRVNLMPPEIAEAARFRQLQMGMGVAVVASVAVVGVLYMHARSGVSAAQSDLTSAQTQHTSLQEKVSSLATVQQTYANVQAKQQLLSQAMSGEIRWSYVLNDLSLRVPSNVWLTSATATEATAGPTSTASTTPTSIGSIEFDGVALSHDDVARWLDALAAEHGFANASFSSSTESAIGSRTTYEFNSSTDLDSSALSGRYVQKASN
jgi:Tfp pilus assembly protein PilN